MKKYLVLNVNNQVEYEITTTEDPTGKRISLYRSNSNIWSESCRGELINSMFDSGNGIKFDKLKSKMSYSEIVEFRILIEFNCTQDDNLHGELRIIEDKTIITIK